MKMKLNFGSVANGAFLCVLAMLIQTAFSDDASKEVKQPRLLRHVVMFKFKESASKADIEKITSAFAELPTKIDSIKDFEWGTNNSPEDLNKGLTHCFIVTFADEAGRQEYLPHAAHKAFVEILKPHMDDVCVVDFWNKPAPKKMAE